MINKKYKIRVYFLDFSNIEGMASKDLCFFVKFSKNCLFLEPENKNFVIREYRTVLLISTEISILFSAFSVFFGWFRETKLVRETRFYAQLLTKITFNELGSFRKILPKFENLRPCAPS